VLPGVGMLTTFGTGLGADQAGVAGRGAHHAKGSGTLGG